MCFETLHKKNKMSRILYEISLIVLFSFFITELIGEEDCNKLGVLLYEDIGCKPLEGGDCPKKFDCDLATPRSGCNFAGKHYAQGQSIDDSHLNAACKVGCRCEQSPTGKNFNCAILDCPEWLGVYANRPGCYLKYDVDGCCSIKQICETDVEVCEVDGKKYKEGDRFFPKNKCLRCVCQKGFQGKFEEPFCKKKVCAAQIDNSDQLSKKCAVYYEAKKGDVLCCPDGYLCPTSNEEIKEVSEVNEDLTCEFGTKTLKKGQGFETEYNYTYRPKKVQVQCECQLPPLVTCWEK